MLSTPAGRDDVQYQEGANYCMEELCQMRENCVEDTHDVQLMFPPQIRKVKKG